jgi:serine beta-lactamase-like protein LACTB
LNPDPDCHANNKRSVILKINRKVISLFLVLLLMPVGGVLARGSNVDEQARAHMQQFFEANESAGLTVTVGLAGKIVWSAGFGYADLEQQVPVDPAKTLFRIGSVIKPMTAYAVAQLVESGKLDLDAPIQTYVPDFPQKRWPITTRQLLAHLAGIRHYAGAVEFLSRERYATVSDGLVIFQDDPLLQKPGDAYKYSSYGYNLISAAIEGASGQDYLGYMSDNVFTPMAMANTVPDYIEHIIPGRGRYYYKKDNVVLNAPEVDNSYKWASGGYIGSSDDLVRFGLAQLGNGSISADTKKMFWTVQLTSSGEETGYGLGWRVTTDDKGREWIGHGGGSVGGSTQLWINPENGLVIAMISNMSEFDFGKVLISLGDIFVTAGE